MAVLRDVDMPDPFDLTAFCDSLASRRGRRLHLQPFCPSAAGQLPCGIYLSVGDDDYIFFDGRTSSLHRDHIVLHEISHMLLGHTTDVGLLDAVGRLLPSIDPRVLETVLARTSYSTEHEREAELLATLIGGGTTAHAGTVTRVAAAEASPILRRLHTTLSHVTARQHRR
jgi:hypothetical protein